MSIRGAPAAEITSTERRTDSRSFMPVERIMGLPNEAMCPSRGRLLHSPEPILKPGTPMSSRRSAASREKGVLR